MKLTDNMTHKMINKITPQKSQRKAIKSKSKIMEIIIQMRIILS